MTTKLVLPDAQRIAVRTADISYTCQSGGG